MGYIGFKKVNEYVKKAFFAPISPLHPIWILAQPVAPYHPKYELCATKLR
jgi:hypothetical protein